MDLARLATRHLFFTGKGGVGKTSVACATAVKLAANPCGVVLAMGKGGVGKTTIAAAIAVELARRGLQVRLS
jgi:anion-transporting  ArsA/GET3 family ATPase